MSEPGYEVKFILAALATWRATHLLANEDGPADVIARFRARLGQGLAGHLMDCFNCLSLWLSAPAAFYVSRRPADWLLIWLAVSGAACLLERFVHEPVTVKPVLQTTEGEDHHVLRSETLGVAGYSDSAGDIASP